MSAAAADTSAPAPGAMPIDPALEPLAAAIEARPAVAGVGDGHVEPDGLWSVSFAIDPADPEAWEEVRRFAWLFNNLYGAVEPGFGFHPVVVEDAGPTAERHLLWQIAALAPDHTPERALDLLLSPLPPFRPPLGPGQTA